METAHQVVVEWQRNGQTFTDQRYSRKHVASFDGGAVVPMSSSPTVVRVPLSDPAAVDPEEALMASLASCHMLWFLTLAAKQGFCVENYRDTVSAEMAKNEHGKLWVAKIRLSPAVRFSGDKLPDEAQYQHLHVLAHEECFIAASIKSEVVLQAVQVF